jgi:glycosyltransferase involved in cell wall biosynthesis
MIRAASRLASRADLFFQFLGDGQDREKAEALARELKLTNVRFDPPVPYADLPAKIACADICLGEFGDTPQTKRGLANKVYQTLAMGKPLINGDTPSIRSLFSPGEHLAVSPLADPEALAQTIAELADDPARRASLANAGRQWTLEHYTPLHLGRKLLDIISELV